jgi:16S rRNA (guanine1516-N2)-methyltransferase
MIGLLQAGASPELCEEIVALSLPLWSELPEGAGHYLCWQNERLELVTLGEKGTVAVDFVGGAAAHRRQFGGGRGQPVAKAVGIKGEYVPRVLDATAGLGRDAFVLASLGCEVTLIERSPVAVALLLDGLRRAQADAAIGKIVGRMRLVFGDGHQELAKLLAGQAFNYLFNPPAVVPEFDVVFLDPMFPDPTKRAKSKKEMAAFQTVIGDDPDANDLLLPARQIAKKRVIVKRPRIAPLMAGVKADFVFCGESTRFDGYLPLSRG